MSTAKVKPTFPNNPTWEQKCKAAWEENKRLDEQRLTAAKAINELNKRLTIGDTTAEREQADRVRIRELCKQLGDARRAANDSGTEAKGLRVDLAKAHTRIDELIATAPGEDADDLGEVLDMDDEIDALTEVIRAAKKIRRRWRGE